MAETNRDKTVFAHPDVMAGGLIGYARRAGGGQLELHPSIDTVDEELVQMSLAQFIDRDESVLPLADLQPFFHAWRWEPDAEFTIARLPTGDTHYMQVSVIPNDEHPEFPEVESAMIECWVRCPTAEEALEIVRHLLGAENWNVRQIDGPEIHTEHDYVDEPEFFKYFEQAQIDGEVFVYHVTPKPNAR